MKAIALVPGTTDVHLVERPEPTIQKPDEVKLKVLEVGICGTDRELASGGRAFAPSGEKELIIGHEMLGEVVDIGNNVSSFKKGDLAVITVRRGCGACPACKQERADLCYHETYKERGIKELHGFQAEYVIDQEKFIVKASHSLRHIAVLTEPTSVVEKAIHEALSLQQSRLPAWSKPEDLANKCALIAGLGPVGLLAAFVLKLRGFQILGMDIVAEDSLRARILKEIGGTYINGKMISPETIHTKYGEIDFILEATGNADICFRLLHALGVDGVYVLTGVPKKGSQVSMDGGTLIHDIVMKNQIILGSVNAGKEDWTRAVKDLEAAHAKWPKALAQLITKKISYENLKKLCFPPRQMTLKQ